MDLLCLKHHKFNAILGEEKSTSRKSEILLRPTIPRGEVSWGARRQSMAFCYPSFETTAKSDLHRAGRPSRCPGDRKPSR